MTRARRRMSRRTRSRRRTRKTASRGRTKQQKQTMQAARARIQFPRWFNIHIERNIYQAKLNMHLSLLSPRAPPRLPPRRPLCDALFDRRSCRCPGWWTQATACSHPCSARQRVSDLLWSSSCESPHTWELWGGDDSTLVLSARLRPKRP